MILVEGIFNMYRSDNNSILGQMWMRDTNDNVYPLNEALSAIYLKYQKPEPLFYSELTSNRIRNFETFYDSIFIQTNDGYLFDKYITNEKFEILPYDRINNFNKNKTIHTLDYWFDEIEQKVYFFEFIDPGYTLPIVDYSTIAYAFNFKSFDIKTNIISTLISKKIYFWLYQAKDLFLSNGVFGNPKLSYNPDTKNFNVSFIVRNDTSSSLGMISMNFDKQEILEINTWIPFGEVMPLGYEPLDDSNNIPFFNCSEDIVNGDQGFSQFYIGFGSLTGTAGIRYSSYSIPDKFDIIWNGKTYTTDYVGDPAYNNDLIALGIPTSAIKTGAETGEGTLTFIKEFEYPNYALVRIAAPLGGTKWNVQPICVYTPQPSPTPTPTKTPNFTSSPTPTPTRTPTPTPTPPLPASFKSIYVAFE